MNPFYWLLIGLLALSMMIACLCVFLFARNIDDQELSEWQNREHR